MFGDTRWYLAGGVTSCLGAYDFEDAANYADALRNLANPALPLTEGNSTVPWATGDGMKFVAANSKYLRTGITPANTSYTVIVKYSNIVAAGNTLIGNYLDTTHGLIIQLSTVALNYINAYNGKSVTNVPLLWEGVYAIAGLNAYRNGVLEASAIAAGGDRANYELTIGALRYSGGISQYVTAYIRKLAIYNAILSQPTIAAISNRMGTTPNLALMTAFGDSITEGTGASDAAHRWANIVAATRGWALTNAGISSTTLQNTAQNTVALVGGAAVNNGRDSCNTRVMNKFPGHVCILYGLNDLRLNDVAYTTALFQNDLGEVVDSMIAGGVRATNICIGSPPYIPAASYALNGPQWNGGSALKHAAYVAAAASVAGTRGTKYVDVYQYMADNGGDALVGVDGIHPNDAGHAAIASAFLLVV